MQGLQNSFLLVNIAEIVILPGESFVEDCCYGPLFGGEKPGLICRVVGLDETRLSRSTSERVRSIYLAHWSAEIFLQVSGNFAAAVSKHGGGEVVLIPGIDSKRGLVSLVEPFRTADIGSFVGTSDPARSGKEFVGKEEARIHQAKSHLRTS